MRSPRRSGRVARSAIAVLAVIATVGVPAHAQAVEVFDEVVEIVFPTDPSVAQFSNDYDSARGGGSRVHMATDIIVPKHTPLYAAADGVICYITGIDEPEPTWGHHLKICGDDGVEYDYIHINNDTPGTDDGMGGPENAYASGVRRGVRVAAGQLVAWAGDSGNAENSVSHLHFEMEHPDVVSPYGTPRLNPYPSLVAALEAGRISDGTATVTDPKGRVAGPDRIATALAVAGEGFRRAATVVLTRADLPWPAIVGGPLAAAHGGPVLTTAPGALDERVRERLADLGTTRVFVVGPLDFDPAQALQGLDVTEVVLLDGADRYETSAMVAELVWEATGAPNPGDPAPGDPAPDDAPTEPVDVPSIDGDVLPYAGDLNHLDELWLGLLEGWLDPDDLADAERAGLAELQDRGPSLVVTDNDQRVGGHHLEGAVIQVDFAVQLVGLDPREVQRVDFWYDDNDGDRDVRERFAPYDAAGGREDGPNLFSVEDWGSGDHSIRAEVRYEDGTLDLLEAEFSIGGERRHPEIDSRDAIIALGDHEDPNRSWPDALMASYYGAARRIPVLLTPPDHAHVAVAEALTGADTGWVIGGPGAISPDIIDNLAFASGATFERLAGTNRYATALAVADDLLDRGLVALGTVWVATGHNWPDATAAGPVIADARDVMLLVNGSGAGGDDDARAWLRARAGEIDRITALGGPGAVATDVLTEAAVAIT